MKKNAVSPMTLCPTLPAMRSSAGIQGFDARGSAGEFKYIKLNSDEHVVLMAENCPTPRYAHWFIVEIRVFEGMADC